MSIYSQITANKRKTWLIISLFVAFITTLAFVYGKASGYGWPAAIFALTLSTIISLGSYFFSDQLVLSMSSAQPIKKEDNPELFRIVENLCIGEGIPVPKIYIIDDT